MDTAVAGSLRKASLPLRWFFTFIAAEFLLIAMIGFAPTSIAILRGTMESPPPIIHLHAALMMSWMIAFLVQALRDSEAHKSYIILATLVPLDAGLNRMSWLPAFGLPWATPIWAVAVAVILLRLDLGRVHKATWIGGGLVAIYWLGMTIFLVAAG